MTDTLSAGEFQAKLQRLDGLLHELARLGDSTVQSRIREIIQTVLDLHGVGLERLLQHLQAAGEPWTALLGTCARDEVISGLLLLHGLHPLGLEERVRQALEQVKPYLRSHGGSVELLDVSDGVVRLRLEGNCHGCPSSAATMRQTIEEAILGKAPDVLAVEVEGLVDVPVATDSGPRVALPVLG